VRQFYVGMAWGSFILGGVFMLTGNDIRAARAYGMAAFMMAVAIYERLGERRQ
jgi:hypothetical protein